MNLPNSYQPLRAAAVALAAAIIASSTASAQTPPTPTHTFQQTTNNTFGTNTNWSLSTLPVAGSQVLIADGKTATMTSGNGDTLFGSLTLGTNSVINLASANTAGLAGGSVIYFNNGSQLNYTSGGTNRANTYNIVSGATVGMHLGQSGSDSLPQGTMVGGSNTVVNMTTAITLNMRLDASLFNGTLNFKTNVANNARLVNLSFATNAFGSGIANFDTFVRGVGKSNWIHDSGTLQLTGSSGGASNVKFDMGGNTDTIGGLIIDTPINATASAPTYRGSNTLTVSGTTTFQGTAGAVNFDSSNGTPSSHNLITTGNMTFGGTGTWAVSGDGRINLNATGGTRTITTNTNASISNTLVGTQGFTKAGASSLTLDGSAANVITGGIALNAGTLTLDYANIATPTNLVASGNALTLRGGNLLLKGKTGGANATSQTLGNVTVNAGGGSMLINPNGGLSTSLVLGTLTATPQGSSLTVGTALGAGAGTATITTTSNKDAQDIYGGRVVFANGTANTGYDWATTVSGGAPYTLSAYSGYAAMAASGTDAANSLISASSTLAGSLTTNSLKIEDPAASQSLDLGSNSLALTSGGLLLTGTNAVQITGASGNSLTAGNGSGGSYDLVIHQYNSGGLDVGAIIANNGANATSLTKAGSGSLTLSGSNTFTGGLFINDGTVTLANVGALNSMPGSENAVTIASSGALSLNGNSLVVSNLSSANTTTDGGIVQNANATAATLTVGNSANLSGTFAGIIQNGTGGGALSLVKTGTGKLTLTNANTYTGSTDVNTGVLNIQNANALGTTAGSTTVASGAALEIQGGITVGAEALYLDGSGISSGGALRNISGNNTYGGLLTLAGATRINSDAGLLILSNTGTITGATFGLTVGGAGNTTIKSIIGTTSGTMTKENGGTLTLTGANTYTGGTNVNGGVLALGSSGALGTTGTISFGGGTLQFSPSNTTDYSARFSAAASQAYNIDTNGQNVTLGTAFTSTGGTLTKSGVGTLTLGGANSYTGATAFNAGTLQLTNTSAIQNTSSLNMANGTTLELRKDTSGGIFTNTRLNPLAALTINADRITTGSGQTLTLGGTVVYANSPTAVLNFTGGNTYDVGLNAMYFNASTNNQTYTLNPTTANAKIGTIRVNTSNSNADGWGAGTSNNVNLILGGTSTNNTITSITEISGIANQLVITKNTAATWTVGNISTGQGNSHTMSAGTLTLNGTFTFAHANDRKFTVSGGVLNYNNAAAIQTHASTTSGNGLVLSGGSLDNTSGAAITTSTTNPRMTWGGDWAFIGTNGANSNLNLGNGAVFLTATRQVTVTNSATTLTVGGIISGSTFGLTKLGAGTLALTNTNSYTGATNINAGTLQLDGSTHASSTVAVGTAGTLTGSGTVNGNATLTGSGVINKSSGTITGTLGVTGGNWNGLGTVTGAVTSSSGIFTIANGANLTSTSGVSATGGALVVNGTLTGTLVANSSTTISGTGTVTGNATISGTHNPGSSPGIQTYVADLTYSGGLSVVNWELAANTITNAPVVFDQITVGGNLDFAGATTLNLLFNTSGTVLWSDTFWNTDQSWTLYDVTGTTFNLPNLTLNTTNWFDSGSNPFDTAHPSGGFSLSLSPGNDVILSYTAIPESNVAALIGGFGVLALLRRRR